MAAVRFDTLDYARKLESAGVPRDQAALQAKALGEALAGADELHDDLRRTDSKIDRIEAKVDRLEAKMDSGFAEVDGRFAHVDARFEQVDARFEWLESKLLAKIDALDAKLSGKIATVHWMFGTTVALIAALFVQQFFNR